MLLLKILSAAALTATLSFHGVNAAQLDDQLITENTILQSDGNSGRGWACRNYPKKSISRPANCPD